MKNNITRVVGVAFIHDNKLLIVQSHKSKKTNSYTFVGGKIEGKESIYEAAVREVEEEIHNGFNILESDLELVMQKQEVSVSEPSKMIEMNVLIAHKDIDVELIPNEEILEYHWYSIGEDLKVSNSIKDFLEYATKRGILTRKSNKR